MARGYWLYPVLPTVQVLVMPAAIGLRLNGTTASCAIRGPPLFPIESQSMTNPPTFPSPLHLAALRLILTAFFTIFTSDLSPAQHNNIHAHSPPPLRLLEATPIHGFRNGEATRGIHPANPSFPKGPASPFHLPAPSPSLGASLRIIPRYLSGRTYPLQ